MFKHIELGVGARGVSVAATKNIIDAVKVREDTSDHHLFICRYLHHIIILICRTSGCR